MKMLKMMHQMVINYLNDEDGTKRINYGLKHKAIQKVKAQQAGYLAETDWYIIRKADAGYSNTI